MSKKLNISQLGPVLAGFFVMGFIDIVGIASNYIKQDFLLSDTVSNLMLLMVYLWFFLLSVPTGILMNRIGRKNTVLASMAFTTIAMLAPMVSYNLPTLLLAFALIGIGNTVMQVSVNPLLADIVSKDRVASSLTFGQFIKSISSFLGPVLAGFAAWYFQNWRVIFLIFAAISVLTALWLYFTNVEETSFQGNKTNIAGCLSLLNDRLILGLFLGIVFVVGIDVGLNTTLPKYLIQKAGIPLEQAGLGISLYFAAKTAGNFLGGFILVKSSPEKFYRATSILAVIALGSTLILQNLTAILVAIFVIGLAVSNIFSVIFSIALNKLPKRKNELSGLMMMGIIGGAIIPFFMGLVSDSYGQGAALLVIMACLLYLMLNSFLRKSSM
ncbi:MAG TPA: MFS transporter [Bacteroidales bacterium]|nr:MFS transporter [Bacteroidales bacterium]